MRISDWSSDVCSSDLIGQPEVGAAVDDDGVTELRGQFRGMPVRQAEEDDVMTGQQGGIGGLQDPVGQRQQMRVMLAEAAARAGGAGECPDGQAPVRIGGMAEQQSEDLAAGVPPGPGDGYGGEK